jgi:hypothetical protein
MVQNRNMLLDDGNRVTLARVRAKHLVLKGQLSLSDTDITARMRDDIAVTKVPAPVKHRHVVGHCVKPFADDNPQRALVALVHESNMVSNAVRDPAQLCGRVQTRAIDAIVALELEQHGNRVS